MKWLLFTRCATSNASRHFKSPLAMGRDAFKSKHASSVSISGVIDTGVNSNVLSSFLISITYSFHFLKSIKLQSVISHHHPHLLYFHSTHPKPVCCRLPVLCVLIAFCAEMLYRFRRLKVCRMCSWLCNHLTEFFRVLRLCKCISKHQAFYPDR